MTALDILLGLFALLDSRLFGPPCASLGPPACLRLALAELAAAPCSFGLLPRPCRALGLAELAPAPLGLCWSSILAELLCLRGPRSSRAS